MQFKDAQKRAIQLKEQIDELRYRYHVLDDPEVSDTIYDSLVQELKKIESNFPELLTPDSPTQRIGGEPLEKFEKVTHPVRQWSFNDAFTAEEIKAWHQRNLNFLQKNTKHSPTDFTYNCELKIDGLHVVLIYKNGLLQTAATRGNGIVGENVTMNVKTIASVPFKLRRNVDVVVEGEVWMSTDNFEKLNHKRKKENLPAFANPRNAAAGSIRQLDPKIAAKRNLDIFFYDVSQTSETRPQSQHEEVNYLKELGFKVNPHQKLAQSIEEVISYWQHWEKHKTEENYWIDGIVAKIDHVDHQEALGYTGKAPRWALAIKFEPEKVTTKVNGITIQVGRTGKLTPVAELEPISVAGSTVSRATLHNEDFIKNLDFRIGDTVVVQKAGDVIPEIVMVLPKLRTGKEKQFKMPQKCPVCDSQVTRPAGEADHRCTNRQCQQQHLRQLSHFVGKSGLDIEGLGPQLVNLFYEQGLILDFADLWKLSKEDLADLPGLGDKSAQNLITAITNRRQIYLSQMVKALGIPNVGSETAKLLGQHFRSLEELQKASLEELENLPEVGPIVAQSINDYLNSDHLNNQLNEFKKLNLKIIPDQKQTGPLNGLTFVLTGSLPDLSRDEATKLIEANGGKVSSSVSQNTDYVVAGEKSGSKYEKAKQLKVKIIDESEFKKML